MYTLIYISTLTHFNSYQTFVTYFGLFELGVYHDVYSL